MSIVLGVFWTLVAAGAQVGFVAGIAVLAYRVKVMLERKHDREDARRRAKP